MKARGYNMGAKEVLPPHNIQTTPTQNVRGGGATIQFFFQTMRGQATRYQLN
jgi:hypothetical protein